MWLFWIETKNFFVSSRCALNALIIIIIHNYNTSYYLYGTCSFERKLCKAVEKVCDQFAKVTSCSACKCIITKFVTTFIRLQSIHKFTDVSSCEIFWTQSFTKCLCNNRPANQLKKETVRYAWGYFYNVINIHKL